MAWPQAFPLFIKPPDSRPMRDVEQEILDELEFHIAMRTRDNVRAGMSAIDARQNAEQRFGDFTKIHKACRQTLLGERIMMQRVQTVLIFALLGAVVFLGVQFYRGQQANEAAMASLIEANKSITNSMLVLDKGNRDITHEIGTLNEANKATATEMMELNKTTMARVQKMLEQTPKQAAATFTAPFEVLEPNALDKMFPNDAKLTGVQRGFRDWSEGYFPALDVAWWEGLNAKEKSVWEEKWLVQLKSSSEKKREVAVQCLAIARCKKAVPEILEIAAERVEKDNADRCEAVRALGILGDKSLVPELVHLTYHYNMNTRLWAQISLVRLTGENFGRDIAAWKAWWEKQEGTPAISEETIVWATSPEAIKYADPKKQEEMDRGFAEYAKRNR